jgi:uncharacterized membrane protein
MILHSRSLLPISSETEAFSMATTTLQGSIHVEQSVTICRPPEEVYRFWRDFENLPRFMQHLKEVEVLGGNRSRWVARGPAGSSVTWEAEIINEKENELIAWQTRDGSDVPNAGSVRFLPLDWGKRTEVKVTLNYDPPAGRLGAAVAGLFGEAPQQQLRDDLHRLRQVLETGEIATTEGQPRGKCREPR